VLYLDASALVKRYLREPGSRAVNARFGRGERIFTSALSYAEIQAVLGRKYQRRELGKDAYRRARDGFIQDWLYSLNVLAVDTNVMASLPTLVERYSLRGADAVHLSSAHWLRDMCQLVTSFAQGDQRLEFGVSDKRLAACARDCNLEVFDPHASG